MRVSSHFLSFFCFIYLFISSAKSQSEWNLHRIKTEIVKMNEKFKFLSDQIDNFKVNLNNNSGWKQDLQSQITNLKQQLLHKLDRDQLLSELQPSKSEMDSVKKELKDLSVKLGQEVADSAAHRLREIKQNQEVEQLKLEKNSMKKELNALGIKLEQEVEDSKTHEVTCKQREEALKNTINEELSELKRKDEVLEKSVSLTKHHMYSRFYNEYHKNKKPDLTWTINDIKSKVKRTSFELLSEVFSLKGYSFGAQAKLSLNEDNGLQIMLAYKDLNKSGRALNLKLNPSVQFTYKDGPSTNIIRDVSQAFASVSQYDVFKYSRWIIASKDIANDTISIDIYVESPETVLRGYSQDGTLTWNIDNFRLKKEIAKKRLVWAQLSPFLYTSSRGYRVLARVWLNGYGEYRDKGLTVDIVFLTGPYDADLSTTFKHKTIVTLFHPADLTKAIAKSVDKDIKDEKWYLIDLATHEEIEKLLDGDTLYYHIQIIPA